MSTENRVLAEAEKIFNKSQSYQSSVKNLVRVIMFQGICILALTVILLYCITEVRPQDPYYAETIEGLRMPLVGLGDPNVNTEALMTWVEQAAVDVLTFGFNDIDARFAISRQHFSPEGWASFHEAMKNSQLLKNLLSFQQIITSIPAEPARLLSSGLVNGKFGWIAQVPVIMTIRAGSESTSKKITVRMIVVKMPTLDNPRGVGIEKWISK
jgi:intracellular multiplication protein IcmL